MKDDERPRPPYTGDERATLVGLLDFQRATLEWKCDGLSDEQLRQRSVPTSTLSLTGIVRHLTDVEPSASERALCVDVACPWHAGTTQTGDPRSTHRFAGDDDGVTTCSFDAVVWEHEGGAAWHFLSVPDDVADDLEARYGHRAAGFGSLRVEVAIGSTRWRTSLFPDTKRKTYVLPLKKAVRVAEGLAAGTTATVELTVLIE